ncbi:MAG: RNA polymerase sigma-70 factor [Muribaculaceae bacterium]|nr:RNA polymerase sigma-70 factor [Muribaculaceae bacterium]MDE5928840.1 RNA polymerase sigma-70 factor [Muribaculaceae bacterium]
MYPDYSKEFERIFSDNYRRLLLHALRFVQDEDDAEDIVADVFCDLWKRIGDIDFDNGIRTYLYKAVSTRALNLLRHRNVAAVRIEALEAINEKRMEFIAREDSDDIVNSKDIERGINEALTDLPEKCREVFVLSYINGLSSKEIAHAMNISVRTVEAHVYKALRLMRARLKHLVCVLLLLAGIS